MKGGVYERDVIDSESIIQLILKTMCALNHIS